jgi:hypothetical protein
VSESFAISLDERPEPRSHLQQILVALAHNWRSFSFNVPCDDVAEGDATVGTSPGLPQGEELLRRGFLLFVTPQALLPLGEVGRGFSIQTAEAVVEFFVVIVKNVFVNV